MTRRSRFSMSVFLRAWGQVLALMAVLFVSSAQPKIEQLDAGTIYFSGAMPIFPGGWDFLIKKGGHVLAYGLLAALTFRAWLIYRRTVREAGWLALAVVMGYALTDELHQHFVPGRHASLLDLGFDLIGAAVVVLILWMLTAQRARRHEIFVSPAGQRR